MNAFLYELCNALYLRQMKKWKQGILLPSSWSIHLFIHVFSSPSPSALSEKTQATSASIILI